MKHVFPTALLIALLVIGGAYAMRTRSAQPKPEAAPAEQAATPSVSAPQVSAPASSSEFTSAQVREHASRSSCWTSINGNVYDVTPWISQHPGGEAPILSLCGTDGSSAFMAQHGGQRRPETELASFRIGSLT